MSSGSAIDRTTWEVAIHLGPSSMWVVTQDVLGFSVNRRLGLWPSNVQAGTADVRLENSDGRYSPLRTEFHGGHLLPNKALTIKGVYTSPDGGVTSFQLFNGYIDDIAVQPAMPSGREVTISCRDRMKELQRREVTTGLLTNYAVSSLFAYVMTQASIAPFSADAISDVIPFAYFQNRKALGIVDELVTGGGYAAYVAADGTMRFRNRYFEIGGTPVASYAAMNAMTFSMDDADIVNRVTVRATPLVEVASVQPIARLSAPVSIPANATINFWLSYKDAFGKDCLGNAQVNPVGSTDFFVWSSSAGTGTARTATTSITAAFFAETVKLTARNTIGATVWVTSLQVRGQPVVDGPELFVDGEVGSSQAAYGLVTETLETPLFATTDLLSQRTYDILELFSGPQPKTSLRVINGLPEVVVADLADVLGIYDPHSGVDDFFTVLSISHDLDAESAGPVLATTYELQRARERTGFILDTSQLDVDRLSR